MLAIEEIKFKGLIGNRSFSEISGPEFDNALSKVGWRQAPAGNWKRNKDGELVDEDGKLCRITGKASVRTKAHIFLRLRERGPRCGIYTPNDFANAIRKGETIDAGSGAKKRVCWGLGNQYDVIYRETGNQGWFITVTF